MAEKHLKKRSASLVIREVQIKMTLRFQLMHIKIDKTGGMSYVFFRLLSSVLSQLLSPKALLRGHHSQYNW